MARTAYDYDLAIVGSGGAAFAAAIRATTAGRRVLLVERSTLGGTCVNTGCVPSKALLAAAAARHAAREATRFPGIRSSAMTVDPKALASGKRDLVESLRANKYTDLAADYGWDLKPGEAAFTGTPEDPTLLITGPDGERTRVAAAHYLIATGSAPWIPPIEGLAGIDYLTSASAMELTDLPESLLVLGGGYVALEHAQLFARLWTKVTILARSRLASHEEPEASDALAGALAAECIRVVPRARVVSVRTDHATGEAVAVAEVHGVREEFRAAHVLVATGRRAVTAGLNLGAVGVRTGRAGEVEVDASLATANPRIWAAGDVTGHPQFVYVAAAQGTLAVDNAFAGAGRTVDYRRLPRVAFTSPALGAVGLTEEQARAEGIRCECRVLPLEHVPRAIVNRDTRGFVKIVAEAGTGRILGLTAVAEDAGELAAAGVYILEAGMTVQQVAATWSPYLTMAEAIRLAAQSFSTDVARLSCCAA